MSPATLNDVFKEVENITRFQRILGLSSLVYCNGELQISRKWLLLSTLSLGAMASWIRINFNVDSLNMSLFRMRAVDLQMLSLGIEMPPTEPRLVTIFIYTMMTIGFFLKVPTMPSSFSCI
ncbi:unnamed protein product [Nezara viridula]|uniref:Uncharacterized protein n=1 Tax=Nezara viridula TaxID=85310 RepID=A0A9P0EE06_NEZVI|nr:unnamed protein product [Nezara viridula]